ncbi:MAG: hypothetical protein GX175_08120 [Halanaerobiaceae bacterium]|jgi:hypothetical protein|nr:hypothetical protein [Halanaerobiaceae bacterium]
MRAWWELYKKELYTLSFLLLVVLLLIFAWNLFLFFKIDVWPKGISFLLSFLPFNFFPLIVLWQAYNSYQQEWKDETNYFILSIPRRGWEIGLAKIAAFMTFFITVSLFAFILILIFQQGLIKEIMERIKEYAIDMGAIYRIVLMLIFVYWITALGVYIRVQFSQIFSLFYSRFRGLITIIVFIILNYFMIRLGFILSRFFRWCPEITLESLNLSGPFFTSLDRVINSGFIVASMLLHAAIFLLGSWIIEKHLEV